ncbi:hypothetical protein FKM82_027170 [Ascaphus truei]
MPIAHVRNRVDKQIKANVHPSKKIYVSDDKKMQMSYDKCQMLCFSVQVVKKRRDKGLIQKKCLPSPHGLLNKTSQIGIHPLTSGRAGERPTF